MANVLLQMKLHPPKIHCQFCSDFWFPSRLVDVLGIIETHNLSQDSIIIILKIIEFTNIPLFLKTSEKIVSWEGENLSGVPKLLSHHIYDHHPPLQVSWCNLSAQWFTSAPTSLVFISSLMSAVSAIVSAKSREPLNPHNSKLHLSKSASTKAQIFEPN